MRAIIRFFKAIINIFANKRGEVNSPQEKVARDKQILFDRRRSYFESESINIDGKIFLVNSIFDGESKQTVADKIKYLIGSDTKN